MADVLNEKQKAAAWELTRFPAFEGTALLDGAGRIIYAYPQFCEILKLSPAEIIGLNFADFFPYPQKSTIQKNVARVMTGMENSYTDRATMVLPDGRSLPVVVMFHASLKPSGEVDFAIKRIMEAPAELPLLSESQKRSPWAWLKDNYKILATIAAGAVLIAAEAIRQSKGLR